MHERTEELKEEGKEASQLLTRDYHVTLTLRLLGIPWNRCTFSCQQPEEYERNRIKCTEDKGADAVAMLMNTGKSLTEYWIF